MEYNKREFHKFNGKKVLHKVKKQWLVVSLALLTIIGGHSLISHVDVHADQPASQAQLIHTNFNQEASHLRSVSGSLNTSHQNQSLNNNSNEQVIQQANYLHSNIVRHEMNVMSDNDSQNLNNSWSNAQVSPKVISTGKDDSVLGSSQSKSLFPLVFKYVNQHGNVVSSKKFSDDNNYRSIDLSDVVKRFPCPEGYTLTSANDSKYQFTDKPLSYDLHIMGNPTTANVNVDTITMDVDRHPVSKVISEPISGRVGDTVIIQPNGRMFTIQSNGKAVFGQLKNPLYDPSKVDIGTSYSQIQSVKFTGDHAVVSNNQNHTPVQFTYDVKGIHSSNKPVGQIYIHYLDHSHNNKEIPNSRVSDKDYVGDPFNITAYQYNIPWGNQYHYVSTLASTNEFKKGQQDLKIEIAPNYDPDAASGNAGVPQGYVPVWISDGLGSYSNGTIPSDNIPSDYIPGMIPDNQGGYVPGYVPRNRQKWPSGTNGNQSIPPYKEGLIPSGNSNWRPVKGVVPDLSHQNSNQHVSIVITLEDPSDQKNNPYGMFGSGMMIPSQSTVGDKVSQDLHVLNRIPKGYSISNVTPNDVIQKNGKYTVNVSRDDEKLIFNFIDPQGRQVGSGLVVTQKYGNPYQLKDSSLPRGYRIDTSKGSVDRNYQFNNLTPKTITIPVMQPVQYTSAQIIYQDASNGHQIGAPITMNNQIVGKPINYAPFEQPNYINDHVSSDYVYSGRLGRHADTFRAGSNQPNVILLNHRQGTVEVYYVTANNKNNVQYNFSVNGNLKQPFYASNYVNNLPAPLKAKGFTGGQLISPTVNKFTDQPQQIYINLTQKSNSSSPHRPASNNGSHGSHASSANSLPNHPNHSASNNSSSNHSSIPNVPNLPNNPNSNANHSVIPNNPNVPNISSGSSGVNNHSASNSSNEPEPSNIVPGQSSASSNGNNGQNSMSNHSSSANSAKPRSNGHNAGHIINHHQSNNPNSNNHSGGYNGHGSSDSDANVDHSSGDRDNNGSISDLKNQISGNNSSKNNDENASGVQNSASNQQNRLPQTGEQSSRSKDMAALLLSISLGADALDDALRRRYDD